MIRPFSQISKSLYVCYHQTMCRREEKMTDLGAICAHRAATCIYKFHQRINFLGSILEETGDFAVLMKDDNQVMLVIAQGNVKSCCGKGKTKRTMEKPPMKVAKLVRTRTRARRLQPPIVWSRFPSPHIPIFHFFSNPHWRFWSIYWRFSIHFLLFLLRPPQISSKDSWSGSAIGQLGLLDLQIWYLREIEPCLCLLSQRGLLNLFTFGIWEKIDVQIENEGPCLLPLALGIGQQAAMLYEELQLRLHLSTAPSDSHHHHLDQHPSTKQ